MLRELLDKFWREDVWLPPNTTWADVTPGPDKQVVYTAYQDVWFPILFAVVLLFIRYVLERKIFAPLAQRLGIVAIRRRNAPTNPKLEVAYKTNPKMNQHQLSGLAKQLDMTERQVERWWRLRRSQDKPSTLVKFCENMFKASFFAFEFTGITNGVWWYYMLCWAFYWSQIMTLIWDVKRKDFWQYVVHHFATILLLQISWVSNLHRIGTLVVVCHDPAEIFLEACKAAKYAKYHRTCDCLFVVFVLLWFVGRLGYFPFYIIMSAMFRAPTLMAPFPMIYVLTLFLCVLLTLHIFWTWLILNVAYRAIISGQMEGDIRSSSSELSDTAPVEQ